MMLLVDESVGSHGHESELLESMHWIWRERGDLQEVGVNFR